MHEATELKAVDSQKQAIDQHMLCTIAVAHAVSIGLEAIECVHVHGRAGFITQHLLSNFLVSIAEDKCTANASYYAIATLFTNPQQAPGQYVNLYGYYNNKMIKTKEGWRIKHLQNRFFGPGWAGNQTILPPDHPMAVPKSFQPPGWHGQ